MQFKDTDVFVAGYARTPIGGFQGSLSSLSACQLGSIAIKGALAKSAIDPSKIDQLFFGNVLSAGIGQAPARQAALAAGIPESVPCTTVNKVCASGMKAMSLAAALIKAGDADFVVAGGMESMSNAPYLLPKARNGYRMGNGQIVDSMISDGLWDPYHDKHMGMSAELCAKEYRISREEQDEYCINSYKRAIKATEEGLFKEEIVPCVVPNRKRGDPATIVDTDEDIYKSKFDKVPSLRPSFDPNGSVTAANASNISDGAAAFVLVSGRALKSYGLKPIARILSYADAAREPERFTIAPALAMPKALEKAGLAVSDIDFFEVNEAFSVVALANAKLLNLSIDKVNVWGGLYFIY